MHTPDLNFGLWYDFRNPASTGSARVSVIFTARPRPDHLGRVDRDHSVWLTEQDPLGWLRTVADGPIARRSVPAPPR